MPDGDSLNWKIRGKGSRRVLSLVRTGADSKLIGQEACRMLVAQARSGGWKGPIREVAQILERGLESTFGAATIKGLRDQARQVVREHHGDRIDWIIPAVDRALCKLESLPENPNRADIQRELMSAVCQGLVDHRVLQPARQEITTEASRERSEQMIFESEILDAVGREGRRLVDTFLNAEEDSVVRAPRRTIQKRETDAARLNEPLTVIGGAM